VNTDHGRAFTMSVTGSDLINHPGNDYFTTSEYDPVRVAGSNLFYFGARYFDPDVGVFTSRDPADQYWNTYSYCGADPINFIDLDGQSAGPIIGAVVGAYVGGLIGNNGNPAFWEWDNSASWWMIGAVAGSGLGAAVEVGAANGLFESVGKNIDYTGNMWERIQNRTFMKTLQLTSNTAREVIAAISSNSRERISIESAPKPMEVEIYGTKLKQEEPSSAYYPASNRIVLNPRTSVSNNEDGVYEWENYRNRRETLGHELIHAYHDVVLNSKQNMLWQEEYRNLGIGKFKNELFTSNRIRSELGLPKRTTYLSKKSRWPMMLKFYLTPIK